MLHVARPGTSNEVARHRPQPGDMAPLPGGLTGIWLGIPLCAVHAALHSIAWLGMLGMVGMLVVLGMLGMLRMVGTLVVLGMLGMLCNLLVLL